MKKRNVLIIVGIVLVLLLTAGIVLTILLSGKSTKKNTQPSKETKQEKIESPEDKNSNLGKWTRAMGAILMELNDGSAYVFGGYTKDNQIKEAAIDILESSWDIHNREELLKEIDFLVTKGHRQEYLKEAKNMAKMSKKDRKTAIKQLSGEMLNRYKMIEYNWNTWKKKGLLAWDLCRVSHLLQWGYVADYLTLEEAQQGVVPAATLLKQKFNCWEDVQNNWLDGYCYFASIDRDAKNTDYTNRKALYEEIKKQQKKSDLLFDDKMFEEELIPLTGKTQQ